MSPAWNKVEWAYRELMKEGREVIKLFSANPVEQGIVFPGQILQREYEKYFTTMAYQPDPKGEITARVAIQKYYKRDKIFSPENILITSGTSESYLHIFSCLAEPGDNILVPQPGYPLFEHITQTLHVALRPYQLMEDFDWHVDMDSLIGAIDHKTRAIVIISPHNPTGSVMGEAEIREIVDIANERGLAIISDEVFQEFIFEGREFPRVAAAARPTLLFTLNGISKMLALPSMKLSWIAVSGEDSRVRRAVDHLETKIDILLACHTAIQRALPILLEEGQAFLQDYRKTVEQRCALARSLLAGFHGISYNRPRGGFYLTAQIDLPKDLDEEDWVIRLMRETGVFVHPGYFYDCGPQPHFVLSFLTEAKLLEEGIGRIVQFTSSTFLS